MRSQAINRADETAVGHHVELLQLLRSDDEHVTPVFVRAARLVPDPS